MFLSFTVLHHRHPINFPNRSKEGRKSTIFYVTTYFVNSYNLIYPVTVFDFFEQWINVAQDSKHDV